MSPASETGAMVQVGESAPAHAPLLVAAGRAVYKAFKGHSPRCQSCIQIKLPCLQREETHHHTLNNHLENFLRNGNVCEKNKLFCNLNFKMGSMWMVRIWVYEAYLFSRYYFNIKGQMSCNSFTNYKVTALKTERPGLENGKFHNILEWDPMWDRWAGPVFSEV